MLCCDGLQDWRKSPGPFILGICAVLVASPMIFLSWVPISSDLDRMASSICCIFFEFASVGQSCVIDDWIGTYEFGLLRCAWTMN